MRADHLLQPVEILLSEASFVLMSTVLPTDPMIWNLSALLPICIPTQSAELVPYIEPVVVYANNPVVVFNVDPNARDFRANVFADVAAPPSDDAPAYGPAAVAAVTCPVSFTVILYRPDDCAVAVGCE